MENTLHACDLSNGARMFEVVHEWTYLLFEEFFVQGDIERSNGMPISMLCDRETTCVPKTQPGFIKAFSFAILKQVQLILPGADKAVDNLKTNLDTWQSYEETDEDKKLYTTKTNNYKVHDAESHYFA